MNVTPESSTSVDSRQARQPRSVSSRIVLQRTSISPESVIRAQRSSRRPGASVIQLFSTSLLLDHRAGGRPRHEAFVLGLAGQLGLGRIVQRNRLLEDAAVDLASLLLPVFRSTLAGSETYPRNTGRPIGARACDAAAGRLLRHASTSGASNRCIHRAPSMGKNPRVVGEVVSTSGGATRYSI